MKSSRRSFMSRLDDSLRWTGIPARVADQMSDEPSDDHKHQPTRWMPIWPITFACVLFILFFTWPSVLDRVLLGAIVAMLISLSFGFGGLAAVIHMNGPLGKPSLEDDEREAALRKDSFLFCLGLLAGLNCIGQPCVLILSHFQNWQSAQSVSVAMSALLLNATLFGCLPTLYASWNLRPLPRE